MSSAASNPENSAVTSAAENETKPLTKSQRRQADKVKAAEVRKETKARLEEKYDKNLQHSDDSSDEEVLLRTGNVPREWYELYDHKGYSVDGKPVTKMIEGDEL